MLAFYDEHSEPTEHPHVITGIVIMLACSHPNNFHSAFKSVPTALDRYVDVRKQLVIDELICLANHILVTGLVKIS